MGGQKLTSVSFFSKDNRRWTTQEDAELTKLRTIDGVKLSFAEIAKRMEGRDARACENRWSNVL